jgi:hypothetical protein
VPVRRRPQRLQVGACDGETPPRSDLLQDRAGHRAGGVHTASRGQRPGQRAPSGAEPGEAAQPGPERGGGQPAPGRTRLRERPGRTGIGPVDEAGQDRQPPDTVGQDVVQHQHQPDPAATHTGDHGCSPQGMGPRQRLNHDRGCDIEQRLLISGVRARQQPHMPGRVKGRVIHPHRAAAPGRHPNQPLPQPRHRPDPLGQHPPDQLHIEPGACAEHQHSAEMLGHHATALHRQQRQIGRTRTLDRHRVPGGCPDPDDR